MYKEAQKIDKSIIVSITVAPNDPTDEMTEVAWLSEEGVDSERDCRGFA